MGVQRSTITLLFHMCDTVLPLSFRKAVEELSMFRLHLVFFSKPCLKHATTNLFSLKRCFCYFLRMNLRHTSSWNDELFLVSTILRTRALPIVLMKTQSVILCFVPPPTGCIDALHHCRIITLMLQKDIFHMITWCISLWKVLASTKLTVWKYVLVLVLLTAADIWVVVFC